MIVQMLGGDELAEGRVYSKLVTLTDREKGILSCACEGKSDKQISQLLLISFDTVRYHWRNIFVKLDACNKTHASAKALCLGLINPIYTK